MGYRLGVSQLFIDKEKFLGKVPSRRLCGAQALHCLFYFRESGLICLLLFVLRAQIVYVSEAHYFEIAIVAFHHGALA